MLDLALPRVLSQRLSRHRTHYCIWIAPHLAHAVWSVSPFPEAHKYSAPALPTSRLKKVDFGFPAAGITLPSQNILVPSTNRTFLGRKKVLLWGGTFPRGAVRLHGREMLSETTTISPCAFSRALSPPQPNFPLAWLANLYCYLGSWHCLLRWGTSHFPHKLQPKPNLLPPPPFLFFH